MESLPSLLLFTRNIREYVLHESSSLAGPWVEKHSYMFNPPDPLSPTDDPLCEIGESAGTGFSVPSNLRYWRLTIQSWYNTGPGVFYFGPQFWL